MKAQASAGRVTGGVVRTVTPMVLPSCATCPVSAPDSDNGSINRLRPGHGPFCIASRSGCIAAASACGGRSPTITTPSRLWPSRMWASAWR